MNVSASHPANLAVFISGHGTGLQSIIDAASAGSLDARVLLVVSSSSRAYGLQRAAQAGIVTFVFSERNYPSPDEAARDLMAHLSGKQIDFIALAGYLKFLPTAVVRAYAGRIANIHPALLPKYGGKGMYGRHVHEAVLAAGEKETGATVHLVDEIYDHGAILEQVHVPILPGDTVDSLAERVLREEHILYPRTLQKLIKGEYQL